LDRRPAFRISRGPTRQDKLQDVPSRVPGCGLDRSTSQAAVRWASVVHGWLRRDEATMPRWHWRRGTRAPGGGVAVDRIWRWLQPGVQAPQARVSGRHARRSTRTWTTTSPRTTCGGACVGAQTPS